ncbi:MAG: hypothetical protein IPJ18_15840 [Betaproteobacteria bacterium]|nr:hypothetical protein [Betaproteobacteria bacterium]
MIQIPLLNASGALFKYGACWIDLPHRIHFCGTNSGIIAHLYPTAKPAIWPCSIAGETTFGFNVFLVERGPGLDHRDVPVVLFEEPTLGRRRSGARNAQQSCECND